MKAERVRRASTIQWNTNCKRCDWGSGRSIMRGDSQQSAGIPSQTLENWVRQAAKGQLAGGQAGKRGINRIDATESRACKDEAGARHSKKTMAYFARELV